MSFFPHMFEPLTIKKIEFKNRVFASPVSVTRIVDHGYPTPEGIDEYENRARGGFAQVTFTESFIDAEFSQRHEHGMNVYENDMRAIRNEMIMTLTEGIKCHEAIASIQLNHVGHVNHPLKCIDQKNPIGPSAFLRDDGIQIDEMDEAMMSRVADNYARTAFNCKNLGFDMVMLHGGHGWLLSQFISPLSNHRNDEYGGSLENRAKFPIMVLDRIREKCGDDFLIEYRVSGSERVPGGMELDETIRFCRMIQNKIDIIHVTSGIYHAHVETKAFSSMFDAHGCNLDMAAAIKAEVNVPVVSVGGFNSPEQIEKAIAEGKCDFVALGRQQIADPEFVNKAMTGRADQISPCLRCSCFNTLPVNPEGFIPPPLPICAVNPRSNRDLRWRNAPIPKGKRRILVIGGGVSGMYGAFTAAERGHEVILAEKTDKLGGLLWFTDVDDHKESLRRYRDSLIARCKYNNVDIRLNTDVTRNYITKIAPDAVICAVGSTPLVPQIKGIDQAIHALEAYTDLSALGKKIVIIGGGLIGCETGYFLATKGHDVHVLEMREDVAIDANDSHRRALIPRMNETMTWNCLANVSEITKKGVVFTDSKGNDRLEQADTIIYATGMKADTKKIKALKGVCPWFIVTGDAKQPRQVNQASYEAFCAAMNIL